MVSKKEDTKQLFPVLTNIKCKKLFAFPHKHLKNHSYFLSSCPHKPRKNYSFLVEMNDLATKDEDGRDTSDFGRVKEKNKNDVSGGGEDGV